MTARTAGRIAWTLWVVAAGAIVIATILSTLYPFTSIQETHDPIGEGVWAASWLGFGLVGALIVSRRPTNRIGWLLVGITFLLGLGVLAPVYARAAFQNPAAGLPLGSLATWIAMWAIGVVFAAVVALLLVFPTGRLASRRARVLALLLGLITAVQVLMDMFTPGSPEGDAPPFNPLGVTGLEGAWGAVSGIVAGLFGFVAVAVLVDFVYRFWRSRGAERQQFKWMVLAAAAFPPLFMTGIFIEETFVGPDDFDPVILVFFLCGNGLAAAIGVAVTRHGLYEINRVISRTVSYALLTAVLLALYLGAVTLITAATAPLAGESPVAVAVATLLAAAAFGPARRRIQAVVDRRFNRARCDAAVTVDEYRGRLRDEVDLHAVSSGLVDTVFSSMQPATAYLWLAGDTGGPREISGNPFPVTLSERRHETKGP